MYTIDIQDIGDRIANLTLAKAVELSTYLRKVHGIEPASAKVQEAPPIPGVKVVEKTEFNVVLESFAADKKITVIKTVREVLSLGIKEAKEFVETAPKVIRENLPKVEAEALQKKFEAVGAKVNLQ